MLERMVRPKPTRAHTGIGCRTHLLPSFTLCFSALGGRSRLEFAFRLAGCHPNTVDHVNATVLGICGLLNARVGASLELVPYLWLPNRVKSSYCACVPKQNQALRFHFIDAKLPMTPAAAVRGTMHTGRRPSIAAQARSPSPARLLGRSNSNTRNRRQPWHTPPGNWPECAATLLAQPSDDSASAPTTAFTRWDQPTCVCLAVRRRA
jgi:hypothetical protein